MHARYPASLCIWLSHAHAHVQVWGLLSDKRDEDQAVVGKRHREPSYALQQTLEGHALFVYPIVISADARVVVSGSADNTARVWALHD
jgi:WD40 repeat protein